MRKAYHQAIFGLLFSTLLLQNLLAPLAVLAANQEAASSPPALNSQQEAKLFFSRLAQDTDNPLIAAMAKENLRRIDTNNIPSGKGKREIAVNLLTQNNNSLVVPTMLNHKTMGTFIVDTGATYTVITPRMAKKLGVVITPDTPRLSIITANGVVKAPMVTLDHVTIGEVDVSNVQVIVQDLGSDILLSGLLGMNFFKGMDMAVRQNKLILGVDYE